jgi:hypothetical protein
VHQRPSTRLRGVVQRRPLLVTAGDRPKTAIPAWHPEQLVARLSCSGPAIPDEWRAMRPALSFKPGVMQVIRFEAACGRRGLGEQNLENAPGNARTTPSYSLTPIPNSTTECSAFQSRAHRGFES